MSVVEVQFTEDISFEPLLWRQASYTGSLIRRIRVKQEFQTYQDSGLFLCTVYFVWIFTIEILYIKLQ